MRFRVSREEFVNSYADGVYRRVIEDANGDLVLLEAEKEGEGPDSIRLRMTTEGRMTKLAQNAGLDAIKHILAFDLDLRPFYRMAKDDASLAPTAKKFRGLKPIRYMSVFEALVTAITAQQVNLTFAGAIRGRMVKRWGRKVRIDGKTHYAFPRPERLARARVSTFRSMQFSERKAEYVIDVARAALEGRLDERELRILPIDEAVARLTEIRGVGRWTAEQMLFRALGRVEVFPGGDLGVQKVVAQFCFGEKRVDEKKARMQADKWHPWASLATTYLFAAWRAGVPPAGEAS
ncbi:MAG: DNA-3-methyladenine glycosylase 2 family protein [Nitrospinae bacterium]|nr:DNA-3-methyladenine glycosylase 2 family protein [Nitrospinota bacterium]